MSQPEYSQNPKGRYSQRLDRQNEYFIPGEGISRDVILAHITDYLGNDALVRPGNYNVCSQSFFAFLVLSSLFNNRAVRVFLFVLIGI